MHCTQDPRQKPVPLAKVLHTLIFPLSLKKRVFIFSALLGSQDSLFALFSANIIHCPSRILYTHTHTLGVKTASCLQRERAVYTRAILHRVLLPLWNSTKCQPILANNHEIALINQYLGHPLREPKKKIRVPKLAGMAFMWH